MGLRIRTNVESLTAQRALSNNQNDLNGAMERLSSGMRINKSSDDAAGLAISESLRGKIRGLGQAKRNANDGISVVQVAESGLNEQSNILLRLRELTVQAASETLGSVERSYLDKEYGQLVKEIDRISETTEFNGRQLLSEGLPAEGLAVQIGYNSGENNVLRLQLGDGISSEKLGIADTSVGSEDRNEIVQNLDKIDGALQTIATTRATLGATQSRLNSTVTSIGVASEAMMSANSRIRDVDFAEETAKMSQAKILSQSSLSVLAQANQKPEMALQLLRG